MNDLHPQKNEFIDYAVVIQIINFHLSFLIDYLEKESFIRLFFLVRMVTLW